MSKIHLCDFREGVVIINMALRVGVLSTPVGGYFLEPQIPFHGGRCSAATSTGLIALEVAMSGSPQARSSQRFAVLTTCLRSCQSATLNALLSISSHSISLSSTVMSNNVPVCVGTHGGCKRVVIVGRFRAEVLRKMIHRRGCHEL